MLIASELCEQRNNCILKFIVFDFSFDLEMQHFYGFSCFGLVVNGVNWSKSGSCIA